MASSKPTIPLTLRWAAIVLGVFTFLWLPVEDTTIILLLALSTAWCAWAAALVIQQSGTPRQPRRLLITGALAGLAVTPTALLFIVLKAGVHDHGFLDFTNRQVVLLVKITPAWVGLGLLAAGLYLRLDARRKT
jgi:hypothetical protein